MNPIIQFVVTDVFL